MMHRHVDIVPGVSAGFAHPVVILTPTAGASDALSGALLALDLDGRSPFQTPGIDHQPGATRPGFLAALSPVHAGAVAARLVADGVAVGWVMGKRKRRTKA